MSPPFSVVFAVGPGDHERSRAMDLLEALFFHEPDVSRVWVVDDEARFTAALAALPAVQRQRVSLVENPRRGRGVGWRDGLTVGLFAALGRLAPVAAGGFVLKLDTDSLVIAPFAARIAARLAGAPRLGAIGTHTIYPDGTAFTSHEFDALIHWTARRVFLNHNNPFIRRGLHFNLGPRARRRRRILLAARRAGYRDTACCQGGGYALSAGFLNDATAAGYFADPFTWLGSPLTEDIVMGIICAANGYAMADYNQPGEVFGVKYSGLPGTPAELRQRGYGIIHSVKNDPRVPEAEVRDYFRRQRYRS